MAVVLSDVLRPEDGETGLYFALRNRQSGFSTDTFKMVHKYQDGTIKKFPSEDVLSLYGATGLAGMPGATGLDGTPGLTGAQGQTGAQGYTGLSGGGGGQGETGIQGQTGAQGLQGIQGIQGVQGLQGIQGQTGAQGIQGLQGIQGIQGIQGNVGSQGQTGAQGIQGLQGTAGTNGNNGSQGETGATFVSSNMRITEEGALQIKMTNDTGGYLQPNYFVTLKTSNYENGIDTNVLNMEKTVGIVSAGSANGADCWVTVRGICNLNFDTDYQPTAGAMEPFGISWGEDGASVGMILQTNARGDGMALSGVTGSLHMAKVLYNGYRVGELQGYTDLPVVGYSGEWVTATVVKNGSQVSISTSGFQPGTNVSGSFGLELPSLIQPANIARTLPISCNGTFYNAGNVMYNNAVHGEFESTFNYLYFKNYDLSTSQDIGWTGSCGWYGTVNISYQLTPGI